MKGKSLANTEKELARRVEVAFGDNPDFEVTSAYRDKVKQKALSESWQWYLRKYGGYGTPAKRRARAIAAGGVPANPPDASKHTLLPSQAVDVGIVAGCGDFKKAEQKREQRANECGLLRPIPDEKWHMELDPNWKPKPGNPTLTLTEVKKMVSVDGKTFVDAVRTPENRGWWVLFDSGEVQGWGDRDGSGHEQPIAFHESYLGLEEKDRQGQRAFIAISVIGKTDEEGYIILADDHNSYKFDQATGIKIRERLGR